VVSQNLICNSNSQTFSLLLSKQFFFFIKTVPIQNGKNLRLKMPDKNQIKTHLCVAMAGAAVGWHHLLTSARTETEVGFSFLGSK
jgi:hypothetical protein